MFLEFLEQIVAFNSADGDTDVTETWSGVVWSRSLVSRRTDVDLFLEFLILTINCSILIISYKLHPSKLMVPIPSIWLAPGTL